MTYEEIKDILGKILDDLTGILLFLEEVEFNPSVIHKIRISYGNIFNARHDIMKFIINRNRKKGGKKL